MYAYVIAGLVTAVLALDYWGRDPVPPGWVALSGAAVVISLVGLAGLGISAYILWRRGDLSRDEQRFLRKVRILGRSYRVLVLAANAFILTQLGWAALAFEEGGGGTWDSAAAAIALAPFVVLCAAAWTAVYWADRVLRAALLEHAGAVVAAGEWTFPRYLEFMFRQYLLVLLVPLLALFALKDLLVHAGYSPDGGAPGVVTFLATMVAVVVFAGPWVRMCWRTEALPEGDLRRRLFGLAERAGVRVGNVLVWRTNLTIANGCMVGMVGPLRYIMITDALLLGMSQMPAEVEAVFAHEIAHVKYRHTLLYAVLLMGAVGAAILAGEVAAALSDAEWAADAAMVLALAAYVGIGFGYVSRRCELEADLYAVRATECPENCSPPNPDAAAGGAPPGAEEWSAGASARGVCVHRIAVFTGALARIARLNGMAPSARGWRHFSIARRRAMLEALPADPAGIARHERRLRRVKHVALAVSLAAALAAAAYELATAPSEANNPEHPAGPDYIQPGQPTWWTRLIDRNQVDMVALRPPEFDRDADAAAHLDDGRLAGPRGDAAPADHQVAVADARAHAVAVDAQGERARAERAEAGQLQVLQDSVGRGLR
jgi:Zn-dependent protease with chaperone function